MARIAKAPSGPSRKEVILKEAHRLFISEGNSGLSMRRVAQGCGISLGHLQHFFPTREDLLSTMITYYVDDYMSVYERFLSSLELDPKSRLFAILRYLIEDARNPETAGFFIELWKLARQDVKASQILRQTYRYNEEIFEPFIASVRGDLSYERQKILSLQVIAFLDGLIVYWYSYNPSDKESKIMSDEALLTLERIIFSRD